MLLHIDLKSSIQKKHCEKIMMMIHFLWEIQFGVLGGELHAHRIG